MEGKNPSHSFLHAFCIRPELKFEGQHIQETVILVLRAHPVTQIPWVFNSFLFLILVVLLNFIYPTFFTGNQILFLNIFGLIIVLSYAWFNFLSWFFNVGIITSERILDVDFTHVLYKEVSETQLDKVEDITSKSGGFFESFFNYGDVFIQTAGTVTNIEFLDIPAPAKVVQIINSLVP